MAEWTPGFEKARQQYIAAQKRCIIYWFGYGVILPIVLAINGAWFWAAILLIGGYFWCRDSVGIVIG